MRRIGAPSVSKHEDEGGKREGEGGEAEDENEGVETTQFLFGHGGMETRGWRTVVAAVTEGLRGSHGSCG